MNILLFSDTYLPNINGVATSTATLFEILTKNGHNVYVVTSNDGKSNKVVFEGHVIRLPGVTLKFLYGYVLGRIYNRRIMKLIDTLKIDLIHVQTEWTMYLFSRFIKAKHKTPIVYTYHTMLEEMTYYFTKGKIDRFAKWVVREYARGIADDSAEVVVPSHKTKDYFSRVGVKRYINVVPTGIDLSKFKDAVLTQENKENILNKHNIPLNKKIMLTLGRVAKEKNIEELLEYFRNYLNKNGKYADDLVYVIAGDGPDIAHYTLLAKEMGLEEKVFFIGKVPYADIQYYYKLADLFVSASLSETQGLTYLESIASHKICLVRFDFNVSEMIKEDYNGYMYTRQEEFFEKLDNILSMSEEEKERIYKNIDESLESQSINKFYERIIEVYKRAIRNNW